MLQKPAELLQNRRSFTRILSVNGLLSTVISTRLDSEAIIIPMNHGQLANTAFFLALPFTVAAGVCSLIILRKMRFDGFGISDLWNPTGKLYRRYVEEAKRRNWSLLPVYMPAILLIVFFCYFVVAVVLVLRDAF